MHSIEIVEILRRSTQGMTEPFICRGEDGKIYFVKGKGAGRKSLVAEWLAGNLAVAFNIPVAPFSLVSIPQELLKVSSALNLSDLGHGYAFGSEECRVTELTFSRIDQVPAETQQAVLAFDWWVANEDRTLSAQGGNPNLFWDEAGQQLLVIDHNQAFDPQFNPDSFFRTHAFRNQWPKIIADDQLRARLVLGMQQALLGWDAWVDAIPQAWWYIDEEQTLAAQIDLTQMYAHLSEFKNPNFWRVP